MEWQDILNLRSIRLYAGDIPDMKEYDGLIGLSLTQNNTKHILHDITNPFPLSDNSVDSFQAEDVLEHISYEKLVSVINEIFRILKPNGLFRLSLPDYGCDVLDNRSIKEPNGHIVFDPGGGGSFLNPGHVWFPRINAVKALIEETAFAKYGRIEYLHYYNMDGTFVMKPIDYSKGHVHRTPDFDPRVQNHRRPMSIVVDLLKTQLPMPYSDNSQEANCVHQMHPENPVTHYDKSYFDWQKNIGAFGGIANLFKFREFIKPSNTVIDFGCGGGYLLENISCSRKVGIEVSETARKEASARGIETVATIEEIENESADVIISNHALEHVLSPFEALRDLYPKLKPNGLIVFVVPHQDTRDEYNPDDINKHLYTWNQLTLGSLFVAAGYRVIKVEAIQHQWPPNYVEIFAKYGEEEFHKICKEYAIKNNNYQIRIIATK